MIKSLLVLAALIISPSISAKAVSPLDYKSAFQCDDKLKFNWYCEEAELPVAEKPLDEKPQPPVTPPPAPAPVPEKIEKEPEIAEFAKIQERLQELLQVAYVNPTDENLYNYIEYQNNVTNKAAIFADKWQRVQWLKPELDYSQRFPTAGMAKAVNQQVINKNQDLNLKHLKDIGYGIFFFYRSDCQYCHQMRYPLELLAKKTEMEVLSISMDGVIVDKFPNSTIDSGQAQLLGVTQSPTIMLVNTKTKDVQPISTGWISLQELEKRIYVLTATNPGDNY